MNSYLVERLRSDAGHVLARAEVEEKVSHQGLKGRFRELLIDNLLAPWLPPYVACGTGLILGAGDSNYLSGQEDIVLYDRSLAPPILASTSAPEGVFLSNSVLARIEVKSRLTLEGVRGFIESSIRVAALRVTVHAAGTQFVGTHNLLFAFHSDLAAAKEDDQDKELRRVLGEMSKAGLDPLNGIVDMICIADRGFWKLVEDKGRRTWGRLRLRDSRDTVVWFVACVSSTCFARHAERTGLDQGRGLAGGIGHYLDAPYEIVPEPY